MQISTLKIEFESHKITFETYSLNFSTLIDYLFKSIYNLTHGKKFRY